MANARSPRASIYRSLRPQTERFGTLTVVRRSFRFSGPSGHYEIQPMTIQWDVEGESKRLPRDPFLWMEEQASRRRIDRQEPA